MFDVKYEKAREIVKKAGSGVVAFSGGVDSSALCALAFDVLGDNAVAVTLDSKTIPRRELEDAGKTAAEIGIKHVVLPHDELSCIEFARNPENRCYHCKKMLAEKIKRFAADRGFSAVFEGTNADELSGHRPGYKAVVEAGLVSPFALAGLGKREVRMIAREFNLSCSEKPQNACLSSRIPYGVAITKKRLSMVERAEDFIRDLGVSQVRVRHLGDTASIEVERKDFDLVGKRLGGIEDKLRGIGFRKIVFDERGYRTGSLNEAHSSSTS